MRFVSRILVLTLLPLTALCSSLEQVEALRIALSADPDDRDATYELGVALTSASNHTEDEELADESIALFEELLERNPQDYQAMAMLGTTQALKARFAGIFSKLSWVNRGLETMDAAKTGAPKDPQVRLIRAINAVHLPSFLDRDPVAESDFEWLLQDVQSRSVEADPEHAGLVYFYAGYFHYKRDRDDEALEYFRIAQDLPQNKNNTRRLQEALEDIDG